MALCLSYLSDTGSMVYTQPVCSLRSVVVTVTLRWVRECWCTGSPVKILWVGPSLGMAGQGAAGPYCRHGMVRGRQ